jgi:hypothetical protein
VSLDLSGLRGRAPEALVLSDDGAGGFASKRTAVPDAAEQTMLPFGGFVMVFTK